MSFEKLQECIDDLTITRNGDKIRIHLGDLTTDWIGCDDPFTERISFENLNEFLREKHLAKEIEMKNVLDEGIALLHGGKYAGAIARFDEVICYDDEYFEALIHKSHALYAQGHFVKALRFYKKSHYNDMDYYRLLLKKSSEERDSFPKIKRNIYAGDEAAAKGDYVSALDFYERALADSSKFRNRILFKLLNKKAFVLLRLFRYDEALAAFDASIELQKSDTAYFGQGYCRHKLGLDCVESLDKAVKIHRKHLLSKAVIFNQLKLYEKSLACFDEVLDNHFKLDEDFRKAVRGKIAALDELGRDTSAERKMLM